MKSFACLALAAFCSGLSLVGLGGVCCGPGDCRAMWDETSLTVGNGLFSRTYVLEGDHLRTQTFDRIGGGSWQRPAGGVSCAKGPLAVRVEQAPWSPAGIVGLRVTAVTTNDELRLDIYPGMPGIISQTKRAVAFAPVRDEDRGRYAEYMSKGVLGLTNALARCDVVRFRPQHLRVRALTLLDQTDIRNRLVDTREWLLMDCDWPFSLATSCLDCRDLLTGEGLVFVRVAPMPPCRPSASDDFILDGTERRLALVPNGYPLVELAYSGGDAGMRRALVAFQRSLRPYRAGRDGILLSNTWGAGNRDSRICEEFLLKEIEAGSRIGVDVIQIDDGWQAGRSQNSNKAVLAGKKKVWSGYWAADPDFWKEDRERFPRGLDFIVRRASEKGIRLGLWFGPDSSDEAACWEKDAACLLDYHRRLGVDFFKMDSMKLFTPLALRRNRQMFDRLLQESKGRMVFDLDCTAEVRPGFLGLPDIGPLFVENRYTKHSVYWPHLTLRNLWDLSHVIDPVRLRLEFNNPDTNHEQYAGSPLGHGAYRPDALFATVMAASPLAWMELSDVSPASVAALSNVVRVWKAERGRWHGGVIHPIGNRPDGQSWTGFVSEPEDGNGGYALVFRELNDQESHVVDLNPIFGMRVSGKPVVLSGRGVVSLDGRKLTVRIPEKLDYIWVRW